MPFIKAKTKFVRISPQKARLVARLIRGLSVDKALVQLQFCARQKGARLLKKTLDSAVANAADRFDLSKESLKVAEVRVDQGPTLKRRKSKNRGGVVPILKRTSHLFIMLEG